MAKFTVFFKDKAIHSSIFESGVVHIGRDETNDVTVDSLAVAPAHAAVIIHETESIIKQLNAEFPLIVNGEQHKEYTLKEGDTITIGKHRIVYANSEAVVSTYTPTASLENELENDVLNTIRSSHDQVPEANLQVMGGKHIGRLVPLKKTMTRLGRNNSGMVIITRRSDGYYISMLEVDDQIKINGTSLADKTLLLKNDDTLLIDNVPMQFYMS